MSTGVLDEAYERLATSGPEWGEDRLTNHGPMVVEVLARRGREADIHRWLDGYLRRLDELPAPGGRITEENWQDALGDGRRVGDWSAYFRDQLAGLPWEALLATWWPRLLPGIIGGATHGVIRVGHAVRTLRREPGSQAAVAELARGLGFWAARVQYVPGGDADLAGSPAARLEPGDALDALPRIPWQAGTVATRLSQLADLAGWPDALAALGPADGSADVIDRLRGLTRAGVERYLRYGHASPVLLVHTATAPNAVLHALPVLPTVYWAPSLAAVWIATAAITAAYAPATAPQQPAPVIPTNAATAMDQAVAHGDEHVIKLTDTVMDVVDWTGNHALLATTPHAASLLAAPAFASAATDTFIGGATANTQRHIHVGRDRTDQS